MVFGSNSHGQLFVKLDGTNNLIEKVIKVSLASISAFVTVDKVVDIACSDNFTLVLVEEKGERTLWLAGEDNSIGFDTEGVNKIVAI